MSEEIGTEKALCKFLIRSAHIYKITMQEHYGLPDPDDYPKSYTAVAKSNPMSSNISIETDHTVDVRIQRIIFERSEINVFGETICVWTKR